MSPRENTVSQPHTIQHNGYGVMYNRRELTEVICEIGSLFCVCVCVSLPLAVRVGWGSVSLDLV